MDSTTIGDDPETRWELVPSWRIEVTELAGPMILLSMVNDLTPEWALSHLSASIAAGGKPFVELFRHGSLVVEVYKPDQVDLQTSHTRDEVYVVISGSGWFRNGPSRRRFVAGQVLFVPAGVEHRFENFTPDFSTWVFFYGSEGGEAKAVADST